MCVDGYWSENHLVVEKIANDVITRNWRRCSAVVRSVKFIPFMVLEREICVGSVICDTICRSSYFDAPKSLFLSLRLHLN